METLQVELGDRSYSIFLGSGVLSEVGQRLEELQCSRRAAIITNSTVGPLYLSLAESSLRNSGFEPTSIVIPDGEEHKNLAWLTFIYDRLVDARLDRASPIVALGGGVVGDMAGFAAATFLRGVPYVQLPTTLLAQVDSSVGGKTGVNHPAGKNLIGAFYQPRFVIIDVCTLRSLPRRQFIAGLAEVIKYGIILDAELFTLLERELQSVLDMEEELLATIVRTCCILKARVVAVDEREEGYRSVLNFGHTLGHAVESLTEYRKVLHGEAVAIGMALAARLSCGKGFCSREASERVIALMKRAKLPVEVPQDVRGKPLALAIQADKKVIADKVRFVCIEDVGRSRFEYLSAEEIAAFASR